MKLSPSLIVLVRVAVAGANVLGCGPALDDDDVSSSSQALEQCATTTVDGIDVSAHNGAIDWNAVSASGVRLAFMKATQGTTHINATFARNWASSKSAGVVPSAYHFFDPTQDGVAQARHFLSVLGSLRPGDLAPMLDLECPDGNPTCLGPGGSGAAPAAVIRRRTLDWLQTVEGATGMKPIIYTSYRYFSSNGVDATEFVQYPLFIASLTASSCFRVPSPWPRATFWQHDWHGRVPGISGEVDLDRFIGTMPELLALTKQ